MARIGLCIIAVLLLLPQPSCRSVEQGSVRTSSMTVSYRIFIYEGKDTAGYVEADIVDGWCEAGDSSPGPEYVEVSVEELHEMGYLTGEEAFQKARDYGIVDEDSTTLPDANTATYGSGLCFEPYGNDDKQYTASSYSRSVTPVRVWLTTELTIWNEEPRVIHHLGPREHGPRWTWLYWSHWGHYGGEHVHTYDQRGHHWWNEKVGQGLESQANGEY
jgi:hypothetical protein